MDGMGRRPGASAAAFMRGVAHDAVTRAADALFPPACPVCSRRVARHGGLCASCWPKIRSIEAPVCPVYGTPFTAPLGEGVVSARAIANPPPYSRARAAVAYDDISRRFVLDLKFRDRQDHAAWMAAWMARAGRELIVECDVVVPVPLHWRRFVARRFNQAAVLARAIAATSGLPFAPSALERRVATVTQRGLTATEREGNVARAFAVPESRMLDVSGRRVLLVDDVITTGATLAAAAKALTKAGAAGVDCLAFAMVLRDT
jgi:ComF family protein